MVNVAGGSKGCATCRRRKVKCDRGWPTCGICNKLRLSCGPYRQVFKVYVPESGRAVPRNKVFSTEQPSTASQLDWHMFGPSRYRTDIQIHYLAALINRTVPINDDSSNEQTWLHVSAAYDETQTVYHAAAALGGLRVACIFDCSSQDTKASPSYGKAIQLLSQNLKHPQRCYSEGNIAAALLLHLYELAVDDRAFIWKQHHEGLARLIEFYGPQRFKPWLARKHFMMSRPSIIFSAVETRRRSFLEDPNWKHIPWSETSLPKLPMQRLLDVVADIPGLMQASDKLSRKTDEPRAQDYDIQNHAQQHLCQRILSTLGLLFSWRFEFERDYPNVASTVSIEPPTLLEQLQIPAEYSTRCLWFTNFERAQELAVYNAAVLLVLQLLETWQILPHMNIALNPAISERPMASLQSLLLPSPVITSAQVVEEIFRSVAYFLHPMHSGSGLLAVFWPLWCCKLYQSKSRGSDGLNVVVWQSLKRARRFGFEVRSPIF